MSEHLNLLDPLAEKMSSVPNTYVGWFPTAYNDNSRGSHALSWHLCASTLMCTDPCTNAQILINKLKMYFTLWSITYSFWAINHLNVQCYWDWNIHWISF